MLVLTSCRLLADAMHCALPSPPPHHLQAQRVFQPRLAAMPGAREAAAALPELFPLGQRFKASRRGRKRIGTENPSDDFHRLMAEGGWVAWRWPGGGLGCCCRDPGSCLCVSGVQPARTAAQRHLLSHRIWLSATPAPVPPCLLAACAGDIDGALEGLADAIPHLVLGSLNDTTFQLVRRCSGSGGTCLCDSSDRQNSITQSAS